MYNEPERKIPLKRAIGYVLLSVFIIWGSLILTWIIHKSVLQKRQQDPHYTIVALVQTCSAKECLETWKLAELLDISRDKPQNLYSFDPLQASNSLLKCPVIKKAVCRRQPPSVVHIEYTVREPCALLADYSNIALDHDQFCFPLRPYYTPKRLPELYIGLQELSYNTPIETKEANLAFKVLDYAKNSLPQSCRILRIDTNKAFAKNAGSQELVIVIQERAKTRYLRLNPQTFKKSLDQYKALQATFDQINANVAEQIIDLRCPSIALVK